MGWSLTIGRIAGTDVRLHFTFLLFLILFGYLAYQAGGPAAALHTVSLMVLLFACVVLHEFGHILMARRFGVKTPEVILSPIGGIANMERIPEVPVQELLVAIAGPLVNVVIAALLMVGFGIGAQQLMTMNLDTAPLAQQLAYLNVVLVVFNVIPAFPMDGGRVFRALLAMWIGNARATEVAAHIGQAFAILFVILGLFYNPFLMLIGVFIYIAATSEGQSAAFTGLAKGLMVRDAMEPSPATLAHHASLQAAVDALLATPQRDFPVVDQSGRAVGLLDRDTMLSALRTSGPETLIDGVMREVAVVRADQPLAAAFAEMRGRGAKAEAVIDAGGKVVGLLTLENIAEMMLVERMQPGWRFNRRG